MPAPFSPKVESLLLRALAVISSGILALGCYEVFERRSFLSDARHVTGTVVALHERKAGLPQPEISFDTRTGERISFVRSFRGSAVNVPRLGEAVDVLYLEEAPHEAVENSFAALWGGPLLALGVGALGLAITSLGLFLAKRGGKYKF